jgi:hypothetical protein
MLRGNTSTRAHGDKPHDNVDGVSRFTMAIGALVRKVRGS